MTAKSKAKAKLKLIDELREGADDPLLTTEQASRYLAIDPRTLEGWRSRRVGPRFLKLQRCARYRKSALDEFLAAGERATADSK